MRRARLAIGGVALIAAAVVVARILGNEAAAFAALIVAVVTVLYVYETHELVGETRRMADQMSDARAYERKAREGEVVRARYQRSWDHAMAVRDALLDIDFTQHPDEVTAPEAFKVFTELNRHGALLASEALRERVRILTLIAFTASWADDQLDSPELARLQVRIVGQAVRAAIEAYLREEQLPDWPPVYPMRQWAQAWTIAGGYYDLDPNDAGMIAARQAFDAVKP